MLAIEGDLGGTNVVQRFDRMSENLFRLIEFGGVELGAVVELDGGGGGSRGWGEKLNDSVLYLPEVHRYYHEAIRQLFVIIRFPA